MTAQFWLGYRAYRLGLLRYSVYGFDDKSEQAEQWRQGWDYADEEAHPPGLLLKQAQASEE